MQVPTDLKTLVGGENAMYIINRIPNVLYQADFTIFKIPSRNPNLKVHPYLKGVKVGVISDAFMKIAEYCLADGSNSDQKVLKRTKICGAIEKDETHQVLNWPKKFKWRHDEGKVNKSIEEMVPLIQLDSKLKSKGNHYFVPCQGTYNSNLNMVSMSAEKFMVNDAMQIGVNSADRFWGIFKGQSKMLRSTNSENDQNFTINMIEIFIHCWNINIDIQNLVFLTMPKRLQQQKQCIPSINLFD